MDTLVRFFPLEEAATALDVLSEERVSSFAKLWSSKDLLFPFSTADPFVDFLAGLHANSSSNTFLVEDFFVGLYAKSSSNNQSTGIEVDRKGNLLCGCDFELLNEVAFLIGLLTSDSGSSIDLGLVAIRKSCISNSTSYSRRLLLDIDFLLRLLARTPSQGRFRDFIIS